MSLEELIAANTAALLKLVAALGVQPADEPHVDTVPAAAPQKAAKAPKAPKATEVPTEAAKLPSATSEADLIAACIEASRTLGKDRVKEIVAQASGGLTARTIIEPDLRDKVIAALQGE